MAKDVSSLANSPSEEDVRAAVEKIENCYAELLTERMAYMSRCKRIRERMNGEYDIAADKGMPKRVLKLKVKERELERKIDELTDDLEPDERETFEMISEKLGDFANTPLGQAALAGAPHESGDATLRSVGA